MLLELLSELVKINDVLFIVKNNGIISEIRSNSLSVAQKGKWITVGDSNGPAHMHIDSELIESAEFVEMKKPESTSFSVIFFNKNGERILAAFFTKMYDVSKMLLSQRKKIYDELKEKFSLKI